MVIILNWIKRVFELLTFKPWRNKRSRRRYDEIKALVVENHLNGFGGLVLPKKYGRKDFACFGPPMYHFARTPENELCLFWQKKLMTEEIGPPHEKRTVKVDECH